MKPLRSALPVFAALLALSASSALAASYTVTLRSGVVLETLYPLEEASWDKDTLLMISGEGNQIGLARADVESVRSETEFKGRGEVINSTTIYMGLAANDLAVPEDNSDASRTDRILEAIERFNQPQEQNINTQQFVNPGEAGNTGGIPLGQTQSYSPQVPLPRAAVPQVVPLPTPVAAPAGGPVQ